MTTQDRVIELVADVLSLNSAKVFPESRFVEDLGADSLDAVELVLAIEEMFSIEISDEKAETLLTVTDVVEYVGSC
jgi:acyl carrier protein